MLETGLWIRIRMDFVSDSNPVLTFKLEFVVIFYVLVLKFFLRGSGSRREKACGSESTARVEDDDVEKKF